MEPDAALHPTDDIPPGTTLLGVWAHPDDEAYLAAGLIRRVLAGGGRVVTAFATSGEAGTDDPGRWPPTRLAARRREEAAAAIAALGAEPPRFLGHPDGGCDRVGVACGAAQVLRIVEEVRPDAVVSFGSDGVTGHPDHRAVSAWTVSAWHQFAHRWGRAPRLLLSAVTPDFVDRHADLHDEIGLFGADGPRVTDPADLTLQLRLTEDELDAKDAALAAHATQTTGLRARMGTAYRTWWAVESFRRPDEAELGRWALRSAA